MSDKNIRTVWSRNHNFLNYGQQVYVISEYDSLIPARGRSKKCRVRPVGGRRDNWYVINKEALYTAGDARLTAGRSYEEVYPNILC